jgi:hypothetical protein
MLLLNGQPLSADNAFEHNGIQYPANWLRLSTLEEKQAIGITEVADPVSYDDRFYWGVDNPKDLDQLKKQWITQVNDTVWLMLQKTDYMDSRKANDPEYTPPADWMTWRNAVRAEAKTAKANISAATDVASLQAAIAITWPVSPDAPMLNVENIAPAR